MHRSVKTFFLLVAVPTAAFALYLLMLAQPAYETEAKLIVRENRGGTNVALPGLAAAFLGNPGRTSVEDALILEDYLHSATFIEQADEALGLRQHFSGSSDPFRRMKPDARRESFYKLYRRMVSIRTRGDSGVMTVQVRAFSEPLAHDLANFIIERSEQRINKLNERVVEAQTTIAHRELAKSMERLSTARDTLLRFQIENSVVDPIGETSTYFGNVAALDGRLMEKRTELRAKSLYLQEDTFELRQLRHEIRALEEQRAEETRLLVSDGDTSMAATLRAYEALKLDHEFALTAYTTAMALSEKTAMEASRQEKFLILIAPPHLPERPVYPRPLRGTVTFFVLACLTYGIMRLVVATVRDHTL